MNELSHIKQNFHEKTSKSPISEWENYPNNFFAVSSRYRKIKSRSAAIKRC